MAAVQPLTTWPVAQLGWQSNPALSIQYQTATASITTAAAIRSRSPRRPNYQRASTRRTTVRLQSRPVVRALSVTR
jgi:hypothetical protein